MSTTAPRNARIAVIGGGISGLAAAYALAQARRAGAPIEEVLIEASNRLGGVILTERMDGFVIEAGPDSFLAEKPAAAALCRELGLGESLIGSNDRERRTYILHNGRLVPLPDGLMLLVPTRLWPLATTPLLPLADKLAIAAEWFRKPPPTSQSSGDESVASFVERHFGRAMVENIVDPLLAGVYGGDCRKLSIRSVLARFWEMEQKHGSLTRATLRARRERLRKVRSSCGSPANQPPLFMTLKEGLNRMVDALAAKLDGEKIRLATRVGLIEREESRYKIQCGDGAVEEAEAIVLAMPAHASARVLAGLSPPLARLLDEIPYSSSTTVSLAYETGTRAKLPQGFGFLVPRKENRRMLACTFVHGKFDGRVPEGKALVRCFLGGAADPGALKLNDQEVVDLVRGELQSILQFTAEPLFVRIHRWPQSMAQYEVGHTARVAAIGKGLEAFPGLFVAGNAWSGIGISDCIRTGMAAAESAMQFLCARGPS
ncbi:MAG: protoporphyrinogen oxidase [Acidobacteria bacterium]|nr:protoporphyrinogen oxidase [Acidobacteriota bacterium]